MHKMKKIFSFIMTCLMLSSFQACDFLNVEELGKSDIPTYFSDVNALEPAIYGTYSLLYTFYDRYMLQYGELKSDEIKLSGTDATLSTFYNFEETTYDESSFVGLIWKNGYNIINNANHIIYYAPKLLPDNPGSADLINNVTAQAYFVRALVHFDLCKCYAQTYTYTSDASHLGVPVVTRIQALTDKISRSDVKTVYSQILTDLNTALSLFTESYSKSSYFASPLACKALMARIYLYMHDYDNAAKYASEVISSKSLTPRDKYTAMYNNISSEADLGDESIFRINGFLQGNQLRNMYLYSEPDATPSEKVISLFEDDRDVRLELFSYKTASKDYNNVCMKFICTRSDITDENKHYDPFVLRVSEMYLIRAEAYCAMDRLKDAENDIRALESRAIGITQDEVIIEYSTAEELDEIITTERIKELCFEGHRLFDITRKHDNLERSKDCVSPIMTLTYPDYRFILPIPMVEIEANDAIKPNPTTN